MKSRSWVSTSTQTYRLRALEVRKEWVVVDAAGQTLGRLASQVAGLLKGKHKPTYSPHLDMGDYVVVVNAGKVRVTGKKAGQKVYYRHSGYPGGLKVTTYADLMAKRPERVIEHAVRGMVAHTRQGRRLMRHLKVYGGPHHPHEAQVRGGQGRPREEGAPATETGE